MLDHGASLDFLSSPAIDHKEATTYEKTVKRNPNKLAGRGAYVQKSKLVLW